MTAARWTAIHLGAAMIGFGLILDRPPLCVAGLALILLALSA